MAIEDFFDHTCDIYHLQKKTVSLGYGIEDTSYYYNDTADIENLQCHFYIKTLEQFTYNDPQPSVTGRIKLALPIGTDIRTNDRVVNNVTGLGYIAEVVHNIRDHHLMVYLFRDDEDKIPEGAFKNG